MRLVICFIVLIISTECLPADLKNIYIQSNNQIFNFEDAVYKSNGTIKKSQLSTEYLIDTRGKKFVVDTSSEESLRASIKLIFPDNLKVDFKFSNVKPNKEIYIDSIYAISTNANGDATYTEYYPLSGIHKIELRRLSKLLDSATVNITEDSLIRCSGKEKMECKI